MSACRLARLGFEPGACLVYQGNELKPACSATLRWKDETPYRLIYSYAHKSPEQYLSIYQSGCNWRCKKCHSWHFTRYANGFWASPKDVAEIVRDYCLKNRENIYKEPRNRATSWHAHDLCRGCGYCIKQGKRSKYCPGKLKLEDITLLDDLTWGAARNIVSFTGGDLACNPEFYAESAKEIKELDFDLWILFETNGHGLTPENLDLLKESGVDAFWLDIKAYEREIHKKLTGVSNDWILKLPEEILERDFVLEISTVYIPGWVEADQIRKIAELISSVDPGIPYAIIAFIPEYELRNVRTPSYKEMLEAYEASIDAGLKNVRLGNAGVFVNTIEEYENLIRIGAI